MKPPSLQVGDTIGIIAPSSRTTKESVSKAVKVLEAQGFKVLVHTQTFKQKGQSAGTNEQKIKALHDMFANPEVKAIFAARGGNRSGWLLKDLDYKLIKDNPKIIMGYSDATALLNAIYKHTGLTTFHGPMANSFAGDISEADLKQAFNLLAGTETALPVTKSKVLNKGAAEGTLVGGNLSLISSLVGTPHMPNMKGAILFLEDCSDEISRFDRMFLHLRNAGVMDEIGGLIIGSFTDTKDSGSQPFGFTLKDIVKEATKGKNIPVIMDAPFGHGKDIATYPVGAKARLDATGSKPKLELLKPAVK